MEISIKHGEQLVVALKGRLDTVTSVEFTDTLSKEEIKEEVVVIEAKELEYISSAGLRVIVDLRKRISNRENMVVKNVQQDVFDVFELTGLKKYLI